MATQIRAPAAAPRPAPAEPGSRSRAGGALTYWMAAAGLVLLVWMGWTLIAWATSGDVHQITTFRDHSLASWVAAIVYETLFAVLAVGLIAYVARGVIRARRLTFDAMVLFALFTSSWLDPAFNFYKQIFLYSSQFVNVNAWCGKMPGILNHECGRMPEPLVIPILYMMVLLAAILAGRVVARLQARSAHWSVGRTIAVAAVFGVVFDFCMEMPSLALHLWSYASGPNGLAPPGIRGADRYSLTTAFTFGFIAASVTALRVHRDDRGLSVLERSGAVQSLGRLRGWVVLCAVIGWVQLTVIVSFLPAMLAAPYAGAWPRGLPKQLVNGLCDNNARGTTSYPCR